MNAHTYNRLKLNINCQIYNTDQYLICGTKFKPSEQYALHATSILTL